MILKSGPCLISRFDISLGLTKKSRKISVIIMSENVAKNSPPGKEKKKEIEFRDMKKWEKQ